MNSVFSSSNPSRPHLIAFPPTPMRGEALALDVLGAQMEYLSEHGVAAGMLGGNGEFYALSRDESKAVIEAAVAMTPIEGIVLAGIGFATREACKLASDIAEVGVQGLIFNPPYYVCPTPQGLAEHIRRVTEAAGGIPSVVYSSAASPLTNEHLEELAKIPETLAIKEEYAPPEIVAERIERWGDRFQWWTVGEARSKPYLDIGCSGVTTGLATFAAPVSRSIVGGTPSESARAILNEWGELRIQAAGADVSLLKYALSAVQDWGTDVRLPNVSIGSNLRMRIADFARRASSWVEES